LTPNNTVYKLIGPVLVPQDQSDAKSNVDTRLEFIRGEMCVQITLMTHSLITSAENDWKPS
jgi:chaperonin cofactor prefoldin